MRFHTESRRTRARGVVFKPQDVANDGHSIAASSRTISHLCLASAHSLQATVQFVLNVRIRPCQPSQRDIRRQAIRRAMQRSRVIRRKTLRSPRTRYRQTRNTSVGKCTILNAPPKSVAVIQSVSSRPYGWAQCFQCELARMPGTGTISVVCQRPP